MNKCNTGLHKKESLLKDREKVYLPPPLPLMMVVCQSKHSLAIHVCTQAEVQYDMVWLKLCNEQLTMHRELEAHARARTRTRTRTRTCTHTHFCSDPIDT